MKKIFLTFIVLLFPVSVFAANWVEVSHKVYVNTDNLIPSGKTQFFWVKWLNPGDWDLVNKQKVWYEMRYTKIYCMTAESSLSEVTIYDLNGKPIDSFSAYKEHRFKIVPESIGEALYDFVCNY